MAFTHIQTHSKKHIDNWALIHTHQEDKEGQIETHRHTRTFRDRLCVWGQFILPQVVPDWIWSESHYASPCLTLSCPTPPPQHARTHLQHTHVYAQANAPSHTQVASQRHRSGHQCRHTQTDIPRVLLIVTLSKWDHSYWFRKTGHSDQCYLLICSVIRADPECQNIWLSSFPLRKEEEITCLISGINSSRRCRRAPEQGHLYVIWVYLCLHPPLCYKGAVLDIS